MRVPSREKYIFVLICLLLHTGAIRKNYDAILDTQTESVSWKQLEEQMKDGEKAAPTPSFKFYANEKFQLTPPVGTQKPAEEAQDAASHEMPQEVIAKQEKSEENWWMESWKDPGTKKEEDSPPAALEPEGTPVHEETSQTQEKSEEKSEFWEENW